MISSSKNAPSSFLVPKRPHLQQFTLGSAEPAPTSQPPHIIKLVVPKGLHRKWARQKNKEDEALDDETALSYQRKDTHTIKKILSEVLGEQGPRYWQGLKDFMAGSLSKSDFDLLAAETLTKKYCKWKW